MEATKERAARRDRATPARTSGSSPAHGSRTQSITRRRRRAKARIQQAAVLLTAAVMVAVFFTFALSGPLPPKEMGVILGLAVLLDAALVRLVLIPTLLRVFGRYAWALPRWLDRLLPDVRFGHA